MIQRMMAMPPQRPQRNHLLTLLPEDELNALLPDLERVELEVRDLVYDVNVPIEYAYFPEDGVVSMVGLMSDGTAVEVATVGNEGMLGLPAFLGADSILGQAFSQVAGVAFRMRTEAFRRAAGSGRFQQLMQRYTQAIFTQVAQSSACNRLHLTEERFARWLLMTHDRVARDEFQLTQDFLSQMLGVRRATVSQIAAQAQKDGVIEYSRGRMRILDRTALEAGACECYAIIRTEFERLLGRPPGTPELQRKLQLADHAAAGKSTAGDGSPRQGPADDPYAGASSGQSILEP
jgi:CRP-like cAMP-binding protein